CSCPGPGDLIGDPLWAVLIPPQLKRFRELTRLADAAMTVARIHQVRPPDLRWPRRTDRHRRPDHRDPGLGDRPGRPPILGFRSRRMGHRAVAPAPSRVLPAVGDGLAGVRRGPPPRPGPGAAGDRVPAAAGPGPAR